MGEAPNIYSNLNDQQQFRLNKIIEVKDYFIAEIRERELMTKMLNKYIASFENFDKSLFVLSATSARFLLHHLQLAVPVGIASASFSLAISMSTGIIKNLVKTTQNKKKKHKKIVMVAKSKLNSIESKISEALMNYEISHEDYMTIINEEKNYQQLRKGIRIMKTQRSD